MFTGKDGERIINTGLANIRDTQRKLATYCGFELAIYRIISPDIFFLTERNQCTVTVWDWMKDWMMLLFFFLMKWLRVNDVVHYNVCLICLVVYTTLQVKLFVAIVEAEIISINAGQLEAKLRNSSFIIPFKIQHRQCLL